MNETRQAYRDRDAKLRRAASRALGRDRFSDAEFVEWLIEIKRREIAPSSWRQYRCAVADVFEREGGPDALYLAARLRSAPPIAPADRKALQTRTSAKKAKHLSFADLDRLIAVTIASRSPLRHLVIAYLQAAMLTGLRPCEWPTVELGRDEDVLILTVENAKINDVRAHSLRRTLVFRDLPQRLLRSLNAWIAAAKHAVQYSLLQKRLGDALNGLCEKAFPQRKKKPSLYTPRHAFAANAKSQYASGAGWPDGLAVVAALLGHSTDATASSHYARPEPRKGRSYPIPEADPREVGLVRSVFAAKFSKFKDTKEADIDRHAVAPR